MDVQHDSGFHRRAELHANQAARRKLFIQRRRDVVGIALAQRQIEGDLGIAHMDDLHRTKTGLPIVRHLHGYANIALLRKL